MQEEATPPQARSQEKQSAQERRRGRPRGKKDSKPRKRRQDYPALPDAATVVVEEDHEEAAWAERGSHWEGATRRPLTPPKTSRRRKVERKPLVLVGHGVRLRVHQGSLLVQNGFTHYPQKREELRLFPGDRRLPSRIIALDTDGSVTLDVIKWLSQQRIPLVLLDWQGEVVSVIGEGGVYDPELREAQLAAQRSGLGLQISIELIERKIRNSIETLESLPYSLSRSTAIEQLVLMSAELGGEPPESIRELMLVEARAARVYFACWQMLPLRWKGTKRKPIPPEWHYVVARPSMVSGRNRHATHPVNAMLNYAYAVLESQVRISIVSQGLDPTIAYLHTIRRDRVALVYDLMELLRPRVDHLVLDFARSHTFSSSDFILATDGVCRLHPQLARTISKLDVGDTAMQEMVLWFVGTLEDDSRL